MRMEWAWLVSTPLVRAEGARARWVVLVRAMRSHDPSYRCSEGSFY